VDYDVGGFVCGDGLRVEGEPGAEGGSERPGFLSRCGCGGVRLGVVRGWWPLPEGGGQRGAGVDAEPEEDVQERLEVVAVSVGLLGVEDLDGDEWECPGSLERDLCPGSCTPG